MFRPIGLPAWMHWFERRAARRLRGQDQRPEATGGGERGRAPNRLSSALSGGWRAILGGVD